MDSSHLPEPGGRPLEERAVEPPRFPTASQLPQAMSVSRQRRRRLRQAVTEGTDPASSLSHKSRVLLLGYRPCHSVPILLSTGHSACLLPCPLPPADGRAGDTQPARTWRWLSLPCTHRLCAAVCHATPRHATPHHATKAFAAGILTLLFRWGRRLREAK